jgi:hypothetical protein
MKLISNRKALAPLICGLVLAATSVVAWAIPTTGSFTFNYANTAHDTYTITISSTFNKFTDCTVTWTGTDVKGHPSRGTQTFVAPPYPGRGAAEVIRANFNLIYMKPSAICQPRN